MYIGWGVVAVERLPEIGLEEARSLRTHFSETIVRTGGGRKCLLLSEKQ